MFATTASAQTPAAAPGGAPPGGASGPDLISLFGLPVMLIGVFYFLVLRPQQRRQKAVTEMIAKAKRGDTVVLTSGFVGKVTKVEDAEMMVEIAPTVAVRVLKSAVAEVRTKGDLAPANDAKG